MLRVFYRCQEQRIIYVVLLTAVKASVDRIKIHVKLALDYDATKMERYEPGTLFTEFRRDMVYRLRYRWEVNIYAVEGDMSDETESSNDR